ncbi:MAG: DNA gyrase inhibitor YacG [Polyangiales bacterium]
MSTPCPICRSPVTKGRPDNPWAPFCSGRCKTIDLARWLDGDYRLPVHDEVPDEADVVQARNPRGDA